MMEGSAITQPFFKFYFGFIEKFTPNLHKCPMKWNEKIMLKNCTVDYNLIPTPILLLEGQFRVDINYYSTKLGENVFYVRSSTFISFQKRFPYKKRTKSGKN
jgi:hypothetical protein